MTTPAGRSVPVILPDLGVPLARLSVWFAAPGDIVYEGERLVEVVIGGATFDVNAPATGRLLEWRVLPADTIEPQQVLGEIVFDDSSFSD